MHERMLWMYVNVCHVAFFRILQDESLSQVVVVVNSNSTMSSIVLCTSLDIKVLVICGYTSD